MQNWIKEIYQVLCLAFILLLLLLSLITRQLLKKYMFSNSLSISLIGLRFHYKVFRLAHRKYHHVSLVLQKTDMIMIWSSFSSSIMSSCIRTSDVALNTPSLICRFLANIVGYFLFSENGSYAVGISVFFSYYFSSLDDVTDNHN